jgi:hypothetical protein
LPSLGVGTVDGLGGRDFPALLHSPPGRWRPPADVFASSRVCKAPPVGGGGGREGGVGGVDAGVGGAAAALAGTIRIPIEAVLLSGSLFTSRVGWPDRVEP